VTVTDVTKYMTSHHHFNLNNKNKQKKKEKAKKHKRLNEVCDNLVF